MMDHFRCGLCKCGFRVQKDGSLSGYVMYYRNNKLALCTHCSKFCKKYLNDALPDYDPIPKDGEMKVTIVVEDVDGNTPTV